MSSIYSGFEHISIENELDSFSCLRKSTSFIISSILYLRHFFNEDCYFQLPYETIKLRILSRNCQNKSVMDIIQQLQGSFQAMEAKYLRSLTMGIYEKKRKTNLDGHDDGFEISSEPIEVYRINFDYGNGQVQEDKYFDFKDQTSIILKNIFDELSFMKSLPSDVKHYVAFKLHYYDEVTPADYQPKGYIKTPDSGIFSARNDINPTNLVDIGKLDTKFHSVGVQMKRNNFPRNVSNTGQKNSRCLGKVATKRQFSDTSSDSGADSDRSYRQNGLVLFNRNKSLTNKRFKNFSPIKSLHV